ncbi:MAG: cytidylate kinase-like family protein [Erysipelotrichaceae bacterium]|nr:cytidylate kinase-like family protein [Erysipelotrichaceae bacterium]
MSILITISREFGSGGRELGRRLADDLHIAYYDREILDEIAKNTPYSQHYIEEVSESKPVPLFPIHYGVSWTTVNDPFSPSTEVFKKQNEIMRQMAEKSSCIIIGRAADYILRDYHPYRLFVYADMPSKIARCRARSSNPDVTDKEIIKNIKRIEKNRRAFYDFYANASWGAKENYDLLVNTSGRNIKELANALAFYFREKVAN